MKFIVFVLMLIFAPLSAMACSCLKPDAGTAQMSYINADLIVEGRVMGTTKTWTGSLPAVRFEVIKVIKGDFKLPKLLANYNPSTAACGYHFEIGEIHKVGFYNTSDNKDQRIRGHGWRAVNSCEAMNIEYYLKTQGLNKK